MSRNAFAALGVVLVGALLWMVMAWPAHQEDDSAEPIAQAPAPPPPPPPPAAEPEDPAEPAEPPPPAAPAPATAEAPQAKASEPPAEAPAAALPTDMFLEDQGPVAERKREYESEPRDSAANEVESIVRSSFAHPDGAPDLFKSVLCRQTVCKVELRWSQDRLGAYVAGVTRAVVNFDPEVAVSPAGPASADQTRPIEVYLKRRPPAATP
jgi:hypothetical protein